MKVAAWQYPIEAHGSMSSWRTKLARTAERARDRGAELLVCPEYAAMELTSLLPEATTLAAQLDAIQTLLPEHDAAYRAVAADYQLTIVAGSFPVRGDDGIPRNRALIVGPNDAIPVEKLQMTRFERELWHIAPGSGQVVVELGGDIRLGVAICYDAEFPLLVRRLVAAGANVIAVPSCTDTLAGYHRVRVAALARALENQCYVVQAPTVGIAPWSIALDENIGAAGIFTPCDRGFPDDGVLAIGALNALDELVVAECSPASIDRVRGDGQVLGHRDWDLPGHLVGEVRRARL